MNRAREHPKRHRTLCGTALVPILLLLAASCSNQMPAKPLQMVHVSGSIRERDGTGVGGVFVRASSSRFGTMDDDATTDSSGAFTMDLPEGMYRVSVEPPFGSGFGYVHLGNVSITPRSPRIDYRYTGILVQGTVLSPTGAPLDSGTIFIDSPNDDYVYQRFRNGAFSVLVPRSGSYQITAYAREPAFPASVLQTIAIAADTTLVIRIDGVPMMGTIFGPDGAGIEGVTIRAETNEFYSYAESGAGGSYQFWVREGGYRFRIAPPNEKSFILTRITSFRTISGPTSLDVSLAGTRWSGFVRSLTDSSAVSSATVSAEVVADYYERRAIDTTGSDGGFELILEPGREYDLSISASPQGRPLVIRGLFARMDSTFDLYVGGFTP